MGRPKKFGLPKGLTWGGSTKTYRYTVEYSYLRRGKVRKESVSFETFVPNLKIYKVRNGWVEFSYPAQPVGLTLKKNTLASERHPLLLKRGEKIVDRYEVWAGVSDYQRRREKGDVP